MSMTDADRTQMLARFEQLTEVRRADILNEISRVCRASNISIDDRLSPILMVLIQHVAILEAEQQTAVEWRIPR